MNVFANRLFRATKLDASLYQEVKADPNALGQAAIVVALSSLAAGLGQTGEAKVINLAVGVVVGLVGWYFWSYLVYFIGTRLLPEPQTKCTPGQMLRAIGFAYAPGLLEIFHFIPVLGRFISFIAVVWVLVATIVAMREALDFTGTFRAVRVFFIGMVAVMVLFVVCFLIYVGIKALGAGYDPTV